jgi:dihydroorotate dehydrogenase electron transfer subunit
MTECGQPKKGIFTAAVKANKAVGGDFFRLSLELFDDAAKAFGAALPGQFAEFDLSTIALPAKEQIPDELSDKSSRQILLRRPFSFTDIEISDSKTILEILYCVLGPATLRMKTLKSGDKINLIGPLGNGFKIVREKNLAILVAGGMGVAPLLHLAKELKKLPEIQVVALVGGKSDSQLPCREVKNIKTLISTDDGSVGFKGFVTEMLKNRLKENNPPSGKTIIYTCGPEIMMAKVAAISSELNIPCQVSLERMMACGTGLCQGCAVKCIDKETNETSYKLCCKDGPVFEADKVVF